MLLLRWVILLLLLAAIACFIGYTATGQKRHLQRGLSILKWTLLSAFIFFAVLILQRVW